MNGKTTLTRELNVAASRTPTSIPAASRRVSAHDCAPEPTCWRSWAEAGDEFMKWGLEISGSGDLRALARARCAFESAPKSESIEIRCDTMPRRAHPWRSALRFLADGFMNDAPCRQPRRIAYGRRLHVTPWEPSHVTSDFAASESSSRRRWSWDWLVPHHRCFARPSRRRGRPLSRCRRTATPSGAPFQLAEPNRTRSRRSVGGWQGRLPLCQQSVVERRCLLAVPARVGSR